VPPGIVVAVHVAPPFDVVAAMDSVRCPAVVVPTARQSRGLEQVTELNDKIAGGAKAMGAAR
jgi:hypothetical protein